MINRVLIRIKVVQLLYSYLLVNNTFTIESQPSAPTKEKRFAYQLYLDTLLLMVRLANDITRRGAGCPLAETRFIKLLSNDERLKPLAMRYRNEYFPLEEAENELIDIIRDSALYKNFLKEEATERIWEDIFRVLIVNNPRYRAIASRYQNYTVNGFDRMIEMMTVTFSNFFSAQLNIPEAVKVLQKSLEQTRELYFRLLLLPVELVALRERELEERRNRYIVTDEDLNPNLRFVENSFVKKLADNEEIIDYVEKNHISWLGADEHMLKSLLRAIEQSDAYKQYMEAPTSDYASDCELWRTLFKKVIFVNPDFLEVMEEKSVFWNDDLDIIGTFLLKTIRKMQEDDSAPILEMYKDDEDARFAPELFTFTVRNREDYRAMIDNALNTSSWERDRLAYMDVIIMITAIAEIINYPKIPVTVSINEYIEIAKSYSTHKSGSFIHGILGNVVNHLREEGIINK